MIRPFSATYTIASGAASSRATRPSFDSSCTPCRRVPCIAVTPYPMPEGTLCTGAGVRVSFTWGHRLWRGRGRLLARGREQLTGDTHGLFGSGQMAETGQALSLVELFFEPGQVRTLLGLGQGSVDDRWQARRPVLKNVVRSSLPDELDGRVVAKNA